MKTLLKFSLFFTLLFCGTSVFGQSYQNAIGLRGGWYDGITFRHMLSESKAIEALFMSRWRGWNITGLYEIQKPLKDEGLDWYYGVGAHLGGYDAHYYYEKGNPHYYDDRYATAIGLDGIIGIEYTFKDFPLNIGADIHPLMDMSHGELWFWFDGAISVRLALK
jgi:hypothetical protein